jgi:hypothetical protein
VELSKGNLCADYREGGESLDAEANNAIEFVPIEKLDPVYFEKVILSGAVKRQRSRIQQFQIVWGILGNQG